MVPLIAIITTYLCAISVKAQVNQHENQYVSNPSIINGNIRTLQQPCDRNFLIQQIPQHIFPAGNNPTTEISNTEFLDYKPPTGDSYLENSPGSVSTRNASPNEEDDNINQLLNQAKNTNKHSWWGEMDNTPHFPHDLPEIDSSKTRKANPLPADNRRNLNHKLIIERPNATESHVPTKQNEILQKKQGADTKIEKDKKCITLDSNEDNVGGRENYSSSRRFISNPKAGILANTPQSPPPLDNSNTKQNFTSEARDSLNDASNEVTSRSMKNDKMLLVTSSGRICFACSTLTDPTCKQPNSATTTVKYCYAGQESCLKKAFTVNGTEVTVRDCGTTCQDFQVLPNPKECSECHSDMCNGSHTLNGHFFISTSLLIIIAVIKNVS